MIDLHQVQDYYQVRNYLYVIYKALQDKPIIGMNIVSKQNYMHNIDLLALWQSIILKTICDLKSFNIRNVKKENRLLYYVELRQSYSCAF